MSTEGNHGSQSFILHSGCSSSCKSSSWAPTDFNKGVMARFLMNKDHGSHSKWKEMVALVKVEAGRPGRIQDPSLGELMMLAVKL